MKKVKIHKLGTFEFPWKVTLSEKVFLKRHLTENIRRCEHDDKAVTKDKLKFSDIESLLSGNKDLMLFVHQSQFMFNPVYCLLLDVATPEEHGFLKEIHLLISTKFEDRNFTKEDKSKLIKHLYSKENKEKLDKFGLKLEDISRYYY